MPASSIFKFLTLAAGMAVLSGCFTTTHLQRKMEFGIVQLDKKPTKAQIKKSILAACADRDWVCTPDGANQIKGDLRVRTHKVAISIKYSPTKVVYTYRSSEEMNYDGTYIHKKYHMWIDRLHSSVKRNLSRI